MSLFESVCGTCFKRRNKISVNERSENRREAHQLKESNRIALRACVEVMRQNPQDYVSQLTGCKKVGTLARLDDLHVVLAKEDALECVIEAMSTFPTRQELQYSACESLLKLASESDFNCDLIQEKNGIPALLRALEQFPENLKLTFVIINTMCYLSSNENQAQELFKNNSHSKILEIMSRFANEHVILKHCLFILANLLTIAGKDSQIEGVETVIKLMSKFPADTDIKENGCRTLGNFAIHDDSCRAVSDAGGTDLVLKAMSSSQDRLPILENASWALAGLSTKSIDACEELDRSDGVTVLLTAMERHPDREPLQEQGVRTLCNLAARESTLHVVSTDRVLFVLQNVASRFMENVELQRQVMFAFSQLVMGEEELQNSMRNHGGTRTVLDIMDAHPDDGSIQENGCRTLGNLALNENIRRATEEEGASRAVINAMLTLDTFPQIQEYGAMALMNITAGITDNKLRVKNNGGVVALVTCMKNFERETDLVLAALKALANIIELDEVCRRVMDERGLKTIVNLSKANSDEHEIQFYVGMILCGLSALDDLSSEDVDLIDSTTIDLLSLSSADANIYYLVCLTMEKLLGTDRGMEIFIKEKRLDGIMATMESFMAHPEILQCCSKIIAMLANADRSQLTTDTCKRVVDAMKTHEENADMQMVGCVALTFLCQDNASFGNFVVGEGAVHLVSSALSRYPDDERMHTVGLMVLGNISPIDSQLYSAQFHAAQDLILASMKKFSENFEIQVSACNAVSRCKPLESHMADDFLEALTAVLRRHGGRGDIYVPLARAMKVFWQGGQSENISKVLEDNPGFKSVFEAEL